MDVQTLVAERDEEKRRLAEAVDKFAEVMKARLFQKVDEGYVGWDTLDGWAARTPEERLVGEIHSITNAQRPRDDDTRRRKLVDIANTAMFGYILPDHPAVLPRTSPRYSR